MQSNNNQQQLRDEVRQRLNDKRYWVRKVNGAYIVQLRGDDIQKPIKTEPSKVLHPKNDIGIFKQDSNLTEIDLSCYVKLQTLRLDRNKLKHLNLSNLTELNQFSISQNPIKSLDFSRNRKLVYFRSDHTLFKELDLSHNPMVISLVVYENYLERVTLWYHPKFQTNLGAFIIDNQKSKRCVVVFLHRSNNKQNCHDYIRTLKYNLEQSGKTTNKYNCEYVFRAQEKN